MLNEILLMGRLTRDPELKQAGSANVANFTLAVDRDYKPDGGERECDFIDCVAWRHTADFVSKYFGKGQLAVVKGRLQVRNWEDKDGNKRRTSEVVVDQIYFAGSKSERSEQAPSYSEPAEPTNYAVVDDDDSELPF